MLKGIHQQVERMWWRKRQPHALLRCLTGVYAVLSRFEQQQRAKAAVSPALPMISVGNITVGGSGKTPFVLWLAQALQQRGFRPVLLSRGDGANNQAPHVVSAYSLAREIGDEAVLLFRLSGCPVIAGRDRVLAAQMAGELGDVLILDDGFQYRQLQRACDIVLLPSEGLGNGYLLPAGPLREPLAALARADVLVRSGEANAAALTSAKEWSWHTKNHHISDWNQVAGAALDIEKPIHALSSIARPQRFITSLQDLGLKIAQRHVFPDHHAYVADELQQLAHHTVVTTGKDAVKLLPLWASDKPLWVLEQAAVAEDGLLEAIMEQVGLS